MNPSRRHHQYMKRLVPSLLQAPVQKVKRPVPRPTLTLFSASLLIQSIHLKLGTFSKIMRVASQREEAAAKYYNVRGEHHLKIAKNG